LELTQAEEAANGPDEEETLKRAALEELIQEAQEQTQKKQDLEADLKRAQEPHKATERQLHRLQQEIEEARQRMRQTYACLVQKREEIADKADSTDAEEARRSQELQTAEEQLAATREKADGLKQAISNAHRSYEELEPYVDQAKQNCRAAAGKLGAVENKIRGLENTTGGSLAVFGTKCQKVKDMVRI
jgi:chromosome segregation ATPase